MLIKKHCVKNSLVLIVLGSLEIKNHSWCTKMIVKKVDVVCIFAPHDENGQHPKQTSQIRF